MIFSIDTCRFDNMNSLSTTIRTALFAFSAATVFGQSAAAPSFGFVPASLPAKVSATYAAIGDFNGDGNPDIVATANDSSGVTVILGDGHGAFGQQIHSAVNPGATTITVADVNGDGKADLIAFEGANNFSPVISILLGRGDGTFFQVATYTLPGLNSVDSSGPSRNPIVVADFDRNERPDLALVNNSSKTVDVMLGNGDGTFRTPVSYGTGSGGTGFLVAGDFNRDGIVDLISASGAPNNGNPTAYLTLLLGNGDGTFGLPVNFLENGPGLSSINGLIAANRARLG